MPLSIPRSFLRDANKLCLSKIKPGCLQVYNKQERRDGPVSHMGPSRWPRSQDLRAYALRSASRLSPGRLLKASVCSRYRLQATPGELMDESGGPHPPPLGFSKTGKRKPGKLTLAVYPRIVHWWHPSKNDNKVPGDYSHTSKERVWLQCHGCPKCGEVHEWDARAKDLTQYGGNMVCPYCESRRRFCSCRSVAAVEILTAEWHEGNPPPSQVALGNNMVHKWRCSDADCGHVWETSPAARSTYGSSCPECSQQGNRKGKHVSLAEARPDLVPEWDEDRNVCSATGVTCGSDYVAWWVCEHCGGFWQAKVNHRATRGLGCPKCRELYRGQPRNLLKR